MKVGFSVDGFNYWWDVHSHHLGHGIVNVVDRSIVKSIQAAAGVDDTLSEALDAARDYEHRVSHKYLVSKPVLENIIMLRFNFIQADRCR